ncbi:MAG: 16S rRNA (adenine(1518)-N(6)/adenine(1519)-N(6))-dimethyltransferase RsmA [Chthoniobacteraceae bacterium]
MKLSTISDSLRTIGREPKQSLGQNFLHDQNVARWIVDQLELQPGEPWVEVGPGLGALTEFAVAKSANGLVIEKDGKLVDFLRAQFPKIEIIHGDASEFDTRELFARGPVKVVGNLPYYISSQILIGWTDQPSPVGRLVFTLQKELAERLSGEPRTKAYGALTLLVGRRWHVHFARKLPPSVFMPAPRVESAVVVLTPRDPAELPPCDGAAFRRLVKRGFAKRRKMLRKNIGDEVEDWGAFCRALELPETVRAEELDLAKWIEITNFVGGQAGAAQDVHGEVFDVVDENDRVLRQATRHEVHTQSLRHRAVHIFVFNQQGDLFLQRRSRGKDQHPLRWDSSAAGHVEAGQTYDATAPREVAEELGVDATCTRIGELLAGPQTGWEFVHLFRSSHEGPFRLAPAEIDCGGFFTLDQIDRWIAARPGDFAPGFLECFRLFRAQSL